MQLPGYLGLIYLASELVLTVTKRSRAGGPSRDAQSWRLLWIIITLSICLSIYVAKNFRSAALPHHHLLDLLGVALFVIGLVFRFYAITHLGRFFTVNVAIASDHQLIDTGPYRLVRHPSYTGALLAMLGFALTLGNWLSIIVMMLPIFLAFVYRMNVEERALRAGLGEAYEAYSRRTKRLLPFIY